MIKCKGCGITFEPEFKNQVYHSIFCRKKHKSKVALEKYYFKKAHPEYKKKWICENCGKEFAGKGSSKYCSDTCRNEKLNKNKQNNCHKISGFLIKFLQVNGKFIWQAYKNDKLVLESAEQFNDYATAFKDARSAFRG